MLHALGGSRLAFEGVQQALGEGLDVVALDLPGFGDEAAAGAATVQGMCDAVVAAIRSHAPSRWLLVGHSMGGKVATVVASRTLKGEPGLFGLMGVVLLAASPPGPEPMDEARREKMIGWVDHGTLGDHDARSFVAANVGSPLPPAEQARALADLKRTSPQAWRAWLERGSREDWSAEVGVLPLPALVVVGSEDGDLGEAGQRATNMLVYPRAELLSLVGAAHLLPLERGQAVGRAIARFWHATAATTPAVPTATARLIASDRVSARTRAVLAQRALPDHAAAATRVLTERQSTTLRALAGRVLPQPLPGIDLARRLDAQLAAGASDGWRFADLPPDREAHAAALDTLAGFDQLDRAAQDRCIEALIAGTHAPEDARLSPGQLKRWFEDLRSDLVRLWLAHPATAARIGFDGFANGGDGPRPQGFDRLAAGEREPWEPAA